MNAETSPVEIVLPAKPRSIDSLQVGRALPSAARRSLGPFVFFDHMGPTQLPPGTGLDVRPHPHIHLATVTYLFEGQILHRDSLGNAQTIEAHAINWMHAGRGIVHSERSPLDVRAQGPQLHGLQLWVALPKAEEETDPTFAHHPALSLPELGERGVRARVLAGSAYGKVAPVAVRSPLFYVEVLLEAGARIDVPIEHEERGAYLVSGSVTCNGTPLQTRALSVLAPRKPAVLQAQDAARVMLLGGAPLDGPRYIFWNFVSSSKERIEQATRDWRAGLFPKVPGDEHEHIPLNEEPHFPHSPG